MLAAGRDISLTAITATVVNVHSTAPELGHSAASDGEPTDLLPQFDAAKAYINQYATAAAIGILDRLEKESSHRFTPYTWSRYFALRGHIQNQQGDLQAAARSFLKAKQYRPDSEDTAYLEIVAQKLLGNVDRAFELAEAARARYSESAKVYSAWLQSAPENKTFDELLTAVPPHQLDDPDVALGLALAAGYRRLDAEAIKYAKIAMDKAQNSVDAKSIWASLIIEPFVRGEIRRVATTDEELLKDACGALRDSIERSQQGGNSASRAKLYVTLSIGELLLGNTQSADEAISSAFKLAPLDGEIRRQFAFSLGRQGELDRAISILDQEIPSQTPSIQLTWAQMKAQRNAPGDRTSALEILAQGMDRLSAEPAGRRGSWIETLIKLYIDCGNAAAAMELLGKDSIQQLLSVGKRLTLLALIELASGERDKATTCAKGAFANWPSDGPSDGEELATVLERLGEMPLALEGWKRVITVHSPPDLLRHVMILAWRENDEDYALKLAQEVRASGVLDKSLIEVELGILEGSSPQRAAEYISEQLAKIEEGTLARYLRLRRTHLGLHTGRNDLIERNSSLLPQIDEIDEYLCEPAVLALKQADPTLAVETAYRLVRKFPNSRRAHQAMIAAVLKPFAGAAEPSIPNVASAQVGTAVLLKDVQHGTQDWYVIEDAPDLKPMLSETAKDSIIARAVIGKTVGDEVDVQEAFGTVRRVRIDQLLHKWVFRFQQCLEHLPVRFPDQQLFKKFTINEKLPPQQQFREMLEFVEGMQNHDRDLMAMYRQNIATPLNLLAAGTGKPLFDLMAEIGTTKDTYLRCSTGLPEEAAESEKSLSSTTEIVLEPTAIGTIFLLDSNFDIRLDEEITKWPRRFLISERSLEKLNDYLSGLSSAHDRMGAKRYGTQLFPNVVSRVEIEQMASRLRPKLERLIDCINSQFEIVSGSTLSAIPMQFREVFRAFGRAGADSIQIAKARGALLWTDDLILSRVASQELGCKCAWTQITARIMLAQKNPDLYRQVSLALLTLRYEATNFSFDDAIWAGENAKWNVHDRTLDQLIECFARPGIPAQGIMQLAVGLLKAVWCGTVYGLQAVEVTQRILDRLGRRPDGYKIVANLDIAIDAIFGLHVIAAANVRRMLRNWLDANGAGGLITP